MEAIITVNRNGFIRPNDEFEERRITRGLIIIATRSKNASGAPVQVYTRAKSYANNQIAVLDEFSSLDDALGKYPDAVFVGDDYTTIAERHPTWHILRADDDHVGGPRADFLASQFEWDFSWDSVEEPYDGPLGTIGQEGCPCGDMETEHGVYTAHCWRSGNCCEFAGVHYTTKTDTAHSEAKSIAARIEDDWRCSVTVTENE